MKNFFIVLMLSLAAVIAGCGNVTVPPAMKGKILSPSGYSADVKETGKYRLWFWEDMVLLDASTKITSEPVKVKMLDDLDLTFVVNFRTRLGSDDETINTMFNDITHDNYTVSLDRVYRVYGRDVVHKVAREIVGAYYTKDVSRNFKKINKDLHEALMAEMRNSPLEVSNVTIGEVTWPKLITEAIEKQQERELAIVTEANEQAVKMVQKENELKLAQADYDIRMTNAKALRDENEMTSAGLSDRLLEYRRLEVAEKLAMSSNAKIVPVEGLVNPAMQMRMFSK